MNEWEPDPNAGEGGSDPSRGEDDRRDYVRIMLKYVRPATSFHKRLT